MKKSTTFILLLAAFSVFGQKIIRIKDLCYETKKLEVAPVYIDSDLYRNGATTADLKSFKVPRVHMDSFPSRNYLVSWDLVERQELPVESSKTTDSFGRVTYNTHAVYRYKEFFNHQEKIFNNREEAFRFYEAAKKEYDIRNVVIDSMYYKIVLD